MIEKRDGKNMLAGHDGIIRGQWKEKRRKMTGLDLNGEERWDMRGIHPNIGQEKGGKERREVKRRNKYLYLMDVSPTPVTQIIFGKCYSAHST